MACKQMLAVLAVAAVSMANLPAMAGATEYLVGDDRGWGPDVNYTDWVQGKVFVVGDSLVFNYSPGKHNVLRVSGPDFRACNKGSALEHHESGNDTVPLSSPGRRWYICGKAGHCEAGQKLVITVLSSLEPPSPNAPVPGSSNKIMIPEYRSFMAVTAAVLMAFMI